jgi:Flp pilus assembly pilin Flp
MQRTLELVRRLLREECGQDLVEYGLLAAAIGIAGIALFANLQTAISVVFQRSGQHVLDASAPCAPGVSPPC